MIYQTFEEYDCNHCGKGYNEPHDESNIIEKQEYLCHFCGDVKKHKSGLESHLMSQHGPKFVCEFCGEEFVREATYNTHVDYVHKEKSAFTCTEPGCGRMYLRRKSLLNHMTRRHSPATHYCKLCGRGYVKTGLKEHMKAYHNDKQYECPYEDCSKVFKYSYALTAHKRKFHDEEGKQVKQHMFFCSVCKKGFYTSGKRFLHEKNKHTVQICPVEGCGKEFPNKNNLRKHQMTKHSEKPNPTLFGCEFCDAKFKTLEWLGRHVKDSHNIDIYICHVTKCYVAFKKQSELAEHIEVSHADVIENTT
jgi:KRAB domain-containing zinc finger protein